MINLNEKPIQTEGTILMNIIQQTMEIITKGYQENLEAALKGETSISNVVLSIEEKVLEIGKIMIRELLETLDEEIKESKARKKDWNVERKDEKKTINTILGEITYKKTYYVNKKTGSYSYLLDEQLGIRPHERMDDSLKARLIENATQMSYQKAVNQESQSGIISRMSVLNAIKSMKAIPNDAVEISDRKETPKILYIEADEDHVSIQSGAGKISKIVYVHEGIEKEGKTRNRLKNTRYFTDVKKNNEELWVDTANYIDKRYDMEKVERVYLSGDGALWIKEGLNWIEKSKFVLDKFHLSKYIKIATAGKEYMVEPIRNHIQLGMKKEVIQLFNIIIEETENENKRERIEKAKKYIINNWEGIQRQKEEGYVGCSAEGHVSHVLSDRLSSRPMGWSEEGMRCMSSMRVYSKNGGDFYDYIVKSKEKENKETRIIELDKRIIKRASKEVGIQNVSFMNMGKRSGTQVLLKAARGI